MHPAECLCERCRAVVEAVARGAVVRMPNDEELERAASRGFAFDDLCFWFGESWFDLPDDAGARLEWYRAVQPFGSC